MTTFSRSDNEAHFFAAVTVSSCGLFFLPPKAANFFDFCFCDASWLFYCASIVSMLAKFGGLVVMGKCGQPIMGMLVMLDVPI